MSETIAGPGTVIAFHYDLYDESSDKIESSEVGEPLVFLYGQNTILASLQEAFLYKTSGEDFSVTIPAGKAYGRSIVKVGKFNLDVDANHPLAGKDLTFDVKIVSVRDASEEEIAHGHAHGPGGHQH